MGKKEEKGYSKLIWEPIEERLVREDDSASFHRVERAKVPGGWLVRTHSIMAASQSSSGGALFFGGPGVGFGVGVGGGVTFLPDPEHAWSV